MLNAIIGFFSNTKLTLTQYVAIGVAAVIGFLVMALKVQGTELHALQVKMLEINLNTALVKPQADVDSARKAFQDELFNYTNAGGEL
jgi:hypothetical protein